MQDSKVQKINNLKRFLVLEANAGSGKTFSLVSRYLTLLFLGTSPNKIFALTFTKKATKEMHNRVIASLKNPKTSGEILEVSKTLNLNQDEVIKKSKEILELVTSSDMKISTIDSLNQAILKRFAHYLDIIPSFKVVEQIDEKRFKAQFLESINSSKFKNNLLNIENFDKKVKIDVIFKELQRFYLKEIELINIKKKYLDLEVFDNLHAIEFEILNLANLIAKWLLDEKHKLSKSAEKSLTFSNIDELLEAGKSWLLKDTLSEYSYFKKAFKLSSVDLIDTSFQTLKDLINSYFERKQELIFKNMFQLFEFYIKERENFIKRNGRFSFDDINHFLVKLIIDKKVDSQFIYFRLDSIVEHFLIDEFQDTSLLQYEILKPLFQDILSGGSSSSKTFFYVGDKMQSLYRFRGGFSKLFDHIQDENKEIEKETLPKNYRSKENIVNFINKLFNTKQIIGKDSQKGGLVSILKVENPIDNVFAEINNLIKKGVNLDDIAIICSKNSEVDELANILASKNIDIQAETNQSLIEHSSVKAITQYILYLYHFKDNDSSFYLKNFQAIIGIDPKENYESGIDVDVQELSLYKLGVKIIQHFRLFDNDENTILFLDSLRTKYLDINEFVYNYHLEAGKILRTKNSGVNILTIHKSKGLEFKHIIFLDFTIKKGGNFNSVKSLIDFDEINSKDIVWSSTLDNKHYKKYISIRESENILEKEDYLNRIYVAMTRAKDSLRILQREENSVLDSIQIDKLNMSDYFGELKIELQNLNISQSKSDEVEYKFDFIEESYGKQNENVEKNENSEEFNLDEELSNYAKKEFGKALHSTIEIMDNFSENSLKISIENVRNRFSEKIKDSSFQQIYRRISTMISDINFQNIISNGDIKKEVGYLFNGKIFYIDMLIEKKSEIIICDYKSSDNPRFEKKYEEQLNEYVEIIRSLNVNNKIIKSYLIFPDVNKCYLKRGV